MPGPTLSRIERERIADAAKLAASGVKIRWRAIGMRLAYVAGGKEHLVFSAGTRRVFDALCKQAQNEIATTWRTQNVNERNSAA